MCIRCADIDYPIGDPIWLPCGGSPDRYTSRWRTGRLPPLTPNHSHSDQDGDGWTKVQELVASLHRTHDEIARLKANGHPASDAHDGFTGTE